MDTQPPKGTARKRKKCSYLINKVKHADSRQCCHTTHKLIILQSENINFKTDSDKNLYGNFVQSYDNDTRMVQVNHTKAIYLSNLGGLEIICLVHKTKVSSFK